MQLISTPGLGRYSLLIACNIFAQFDESDLFLPGSDCGSTCSGHTLWDPSSSSTSTDLGQTFSLEYGDGSTVSGEQYTDSVSIAGYSVCSVQLASAIISDSLLGDESDSWRCNNLFLRVRKFSISCRWFDGNGFRVHLVLWRESRLPNSRL